MCKAKSIALEQTPVYAKEGVTLFLPISDWIPLSEVSSIRGMLELGVSSAGTATDYVSAQLAYQTADDVQAASGSTAFGNTASTQSLGSLKADVAYYADWTAPSSFKGEQFVRFGVRTSLTRSSLAAFQFATVSGVVDVRCE
jgi:hypothetical protein